jgi:hypothetical protein
MAPRVAGKAYMIQYGRYALVWWEPTLLLSSFSLLPHYKAP